MVGCKSDSDRIGAELDRIGAEMDRLYAVYLHGDYTKAKRSLEDALIVLGDLEKINPKGGAHGYWLAYCRLAMIEARNGNSALAEIDLAKANYWQIRKLEKLHESPDSIANCIKSFDMQKCMELVDKFDAHNGGRK